MKFSVPRLLSLVTLLSLSHTAFPQAGSLGDMLWKESNSLSLFDGIDLPSGERVGYPAGLIAVADETHYVIWTELKEGRLHLLEKTNDSYFRRVKTIPISIGKSGYGKEIEGDKRTPVGVYRVTSYIPEAELTDFYGLGAYPINYPNNWDRLNRRTGYGIWLHGLPKGIEQRPLMDSDGCVVVDNQSLTFLDDYIVPGDTLVVLANEFNWIDRESGVEHHSLLSAVDSWIQDWESLDAAAYLANYHADFSDFRRDLAQWSEYKTGINSRKTSIEVSISDLTAVQYPGDQNLFSVRFYQNYKSSNYNWAGWKELLWTLDDEGNWKILFEGNG